MVKRDSLLILLEINNGNANGKLVKKRNYELWNKTHELTSQTVAKIFFWIFKQFTFNLLEESAENGRQRAVTINYHKIYFMECQDFIGVLENVTLNISFEIQMNEYK